MSDPKLGFGTKHCKCSVCGEYFTTPANFDLHRRGNPTSRVCVPPYTLTNKKGDRLLEKNCKGLWKRIRRGYQYEAQNNR